MPWDANTIKKHNKSLKGAKAKKAAAVANAVLKKTGDEGKALRIANAAVKKKGGHSAAKTLYPHHA